MAPNREQRGSNSSYVFSAFHVPEPPLPFSLSFQSISLPRFPEIKFYSFNRIQLEHFPTTTMSEITIRFSFLIANTKTSEREKERERKISLNFNALHAHSDNNPCDLSRNFVGLIERKKEKHLTFHEQTSPATPNNEIKSIIQKTTECSRRDYTCNTGDSL